MKYQKDRSKKLGISDSTSVSLLEVNILDIVWAEKRVTVREVHESIVKQDLAKGRKDLIPYTTIMSTMAGLAQRNLLKIDKSKKKYYYSATVSRHQLSKKIMINVAEKILGRSAKTLISKFLSRSSDMNKENISSLLKEIDKI